jgi:hypothetical protein
MIGVDLSEHERKVIDPTFSSLKPGFKTELPLCQMQSMSDALQKELRKFDAERVLPTWDKLVQRQQSCLEALKVPAMFVTNDPSDMAVRNSHLRVKCNPGVRPHATRPLPRSNVGW